MTINWTYFLIGCIGGLIPDLIRIAKSDLTSMPNFRDPRYWIQALVLILLGGVAGVLAKSTQEALAFGYSAPEILSRLGAQQTPAPPPNAPLAPPVGGAFRVRLWWAR